MIKKSHPCYGCGHRRPASVRCGYGTGSTMCHYLLDTGKKRAGRMFKRFTELLEKSDTDEVFWEHIDRDVIDYLGMPFERDYTENGKVIGERDCKRQGKR